MLATGLCTPSAFYNLHVGMGHSWPYALVVVAYQLGKEMPQLPALWSAKATNTLLSCVSQSTTSTLVHCHCAVSGSTLAACTVPPSVQ